MCQTHSCAFDGQTITVCREESTQKWKTSPNTCSIHHCTVKPQDPHERGQWHWLKRITASAASRTRGARKSTRAPGCHRRKTPKTGQGTTAASREYRSCAPARRGCSTPPEARPRGRSRLTPAPPCFTSTELPISHVQVMTCLLFERSVGRRRRHRGPGRCNPQTVKARLSSWNSRAPHPGWHRRPRRRPGEPPRWCSPSTSIPCSRSCGIPPSG